MRCRSCRPPQDESRGCCSLKLGQADYAAASDGLRRSCLHLVVPKAKGLEIMMQTLTHNEMLTTQQATKSWRRCGLLWARVAFSRSGAASAGRVRADRSSACGARGGPAAA